MAKQYTGSDRKPTELFRKIDRATFRVVRPSGMGTRQPAEIEYWTDDQELVNQVVRKFQGRFSYVIEDRELDEMYLRAPALMRLTYFPAFDEKTFIDEKWIKNIITHAREKELYVRSIQENAKKPKSELTVSVEVEHPEIWYHGERFYPGAAYYSYDFLPAEGRVTCPECKRSVDFARLKGYEYFCEDCNDMHSTSDMVCILCEGQIEHGDDFVFKVEDENLVARELGLSKSL